ncbi:cell division control protein 48 homolog C [Coffea eugenioides]|uniref:cell division control protein 48 homolog C n=1 Tax=Coffea eugenioides TaxID=49369 RepID=UPI000F612236|nr:cell division control protein 48 homolog C [Coffea eugenioides]
MRMGRRRQGTPGSGGKSSSSIFRKSLLRDIASCPIKNPSEDQLVSFLRSNYPRYERTKLRDFSRHVRNLLEETASNSRKTNSVINKDGDSSSESENDRSDRVQKRPRKLDRAEAKLQQMEMQHLINSSRHVGVEETGVSSVSPGSSEEEVSTSSSSSSDAIYGEEYEPEFDLMKSQLRDRYGEKGKGVGKRKGVAANVAVVEMEVVNNNSSKRNQKVDLVKEGRIEKRDWRKKGGGGENNDSDNGGAGVKGPKFKDLGGMSRVVEELKMEVIVPLYHPHLPQHLGVRPMAGILLHGPPGCGKTKLAHAIANETGVPFYKISATELVSGISGASEENIRELFSKAYRTAPSIVFIDEIDAIASKRENLQREMERRIVTQLMTCMDESYRIVKPADGNADSENSDARPGYVLVIGATNRPDAVDSALRRPGRFDREIVLGVPDEKARVEILSVLTSNLKVEGSFDLLKIARATPGFVGADLAALTNKAGNLAMKRIIDHRKDELSKENVDGEYAEEWWKHPWSLEEMEKLSITMADFEGAAKMVQPSSRREGFSAIPNVKWEDVGGLHLLRQEFDRYIVRRIKFPEEYEDFGVDLETGFLLYGPPGCGKTLIAKAVANEAGANFIHIKGPELLNKYVGESELAVRTVFSRARTCSPCILFFDEVDALTTKRGREGGWVVERLLNQLLIELDGAEQRRGVYVIGATNRPEVMDRAVLRPGRFGKLLYVPLPTADERGLILNALARKKPIDATVDLMAIGRDSSCENLSGADLSALMNEAAMAALHDKLLCENTSSDGTPWTIKDEHFKRALEKISPSVSDKQIQYYQVLSESFKAA